MSGYLQRMAAAAANPKGGVHPFVEPMFGGQRIGESASPPAETVTERVSETTRSATGVVPPTTGDSAGRVERRANQTAARESYEALLPEVGREFVGSSPMVDYVEPAAPADSGPTVRDTAAKDAAPQRWSRRRDDEASRQGWTFEPLVGETSGAGGKSAGSRRIADFIERSSSAQGGPRSPAVLRPPLRETSAKDGGLGVSGLRSAAEIAAGRRLAQHQQARARAEQQDDIQIHIGRIEVIAMPPAAPRPTPVPVRKTQTLDEYLRRSSGRAR